MANKYWLGVNGTWSDVNNWAIVHAGAATGGVPVNGDTVYLDLNATSIDGYDASAVTLAALYISRGFGRPASGANPAYGVYIGTEGTPLKINATTVTIDNDSVENINLYGTYTSVYANLLHPNCKLNIQGAGFTYIEAGTNGAVTVANDTAASRIITKGASFKLGTYATLPPSLKVHCSRGSQVESRRRVTGGHIGGKLWMRDEAVMSSVNQVETITMDVASTAGNLKLRIQKTDGTFATTANIAWNATDATYLAAINTQLDASTGVSGGIVATATSGVDPDSGFTLTYSGTGYAGKSWIPASVATFPTSSTAASYANVRAAGSEFTIADRGTIQYDAYSAIGASSSDVILVMSGGMFDASKVITPLTLNSQVIAMGQYKLSSSITAASAPRQPGGVEVG